MPKERAAILRLRRSASDKLTLCLLVRLRENATKPAQHHKAEGNVLPLVLFTALVVTVGSVALMARSSNSWLSSVSNSDYQAAKEAAETGFNKILAELNTNPSSHFLVTKFSNWYSSPPSVAEGGACNVFMQGVQSAPSNAKIGLAGTGQFYQLTSFQAPERSPGSPEGGCTKFGNLFGGSADVVVTGSVERGGSTTARFRLRKIVYVKGPFVESSQPPLTPLLITGGAGSTLGKFDQNGGKGLAFTDNPADPKNHASTTAADAACSQIANCISDNTKVGDIDATSITLPGFPTPASQEDTRTTSQESDDESLTYGTTYTNTMFPYVTSAGTEAVDNTSNYLAPGCYFNNRTSALDRVDNSGSVDPPPLQTSGATANGSPASTAINCVVGTINNPNILANTSRLPVNIFVRGTGANAITINPGNNDATKRLNNSNIVDWQKLRIFGVSTGNATACGEQTVSVTASPFDGAFIWMPNATMQFVGAGTGGGQEGSYGVRWVCRFEGPGSGDTALFGPTNALTGFNDIFPGFFTTATNDTFNPSPIPSIVTNYRAYGVTY